MAHIFFRRLERRYSTQALLPMNYMPQLDELETWIGRSIQNQSQNLAQVYQGSPFGTTHSGQPLGPIPLFGLPPAQGTQMPGLHGKTQ